MEKEFEDKKNVNMDIVHRLMSLYQKAFFQITIRSVPHHLLFRKATGGIQSALSIKRKPILS